ncbi:hypothetical protein H1R17_09075 [Flavobacterium sp. xlx-214]|uniref:hypothetical protein n=1 Tax=unclassified Flavobacterium TaxID=196869 RepID=UPI0013D8306A|nr:MULTISPECIES: hypothetical protein [unclassified Flavobacterium]MBA5793080.1 hypothetical protein [Flavobacterium sp. xlx-221]QMI82628.1 hypothetical protein H1R17_09075 [Flavobacterium sp. xlx-214]
MRIKITFFTILCNLLIGNGIFYIANSDFYLLMICMSISCIVIYSLFFRFFRFENYSTIKLLGVSILNCMCILLLGVLLAVIGTIIQEGFAETPGTNDISQLLAASTFMGLMGSIIFFPVNIVLGVFNFVLLLIVQKMQILKHN